jgi:hypothetical protein
VASIAVVMPMAAIVPIAVGSQLLPIGAPKGRGNGRVAHGAGLDEREFRARHPWASRGYRSTSCTYSAAVRRNVPASFP